MTQTVENVLVVVLDTVRARSTAIDGRDITPGLSEVAASGVSFERAITPAPWTFPAHASLFTGSYPTVHGATQMQRQLPPEHYTLAERMRDDGFATGLLSANGFLTDTYGMTRGFDTATFVRSDTDRLFESGIDPTELMRGDSGQFDYRDLAEGILDGPIARNLSNLVYYKLLKKWRQHRFGTNVVLDQWDEETVAQAKSFLDSSVGQSEPFFLFVNLIEAHAPWRFEPAAVREIGIEPTDVAPLERWEELADRSGDKAAFATGEVTFDETDRQILTALYESWVHRADALGLELVEKLGELGVRDETLVILTSDHGEVIAEEGDLGHTTSVGNDVARVPLIVDGPGIDHGRITEPVSLKDIYGTILEYSGVSSSAPTVFDEEAQGVALIETDGPHEDVADKYRQDAPHIWGKKRALYTGSGYVERRYFTDEVHGDESLLDKLDSFVADLDGFDDDGAETVDTTDSAVTDRLDDLGYLN